MVHESGENDAGTRTLRFQLALRYDRGSERDPAQWRFTLSDISSHERVGGVGIGGLAEAVGLLASRVVSGPDGRDLVRDEEAC